MNESYSESLSDAVPAEGAELSPLESADVVEVSLLLSGRQMVALEEAAHDRGLTAGEMVRRLLHEFIARAFPCKVGRL